MKTTICVKCRHHNGADPTDQWYKHLCLHPALERTSEVDPVTGLTGYAKRNDLGGVHITAENHPNCRDHNHGNCTHFEAKQ